MLDAIVDGVFELIVGLVPDRQPWRGIAFALMILFVLGAIAAVVIVAT